MRKLWVVAVVGALALALAACGGGGSSPLAGVGGGGGSKNAFSALVAKTNSATYKVTYKSGTSTPFTIAQQPPRFSYKSGDSSTFITADGSAVSCSGSGSSATCTSLPGTGASIKQGLTSAFGAVGALIVSAAGSGVPGLSSVSKTSTKQIAGRTAVCATIGASGLLSAAIKGTYTVCVDKDTGVMLESTTNDGSGQTSSVIATSFGKPTSADLTPPATPVTIPGLTTPST